MDHRPEVGSGPLPDPAAGVHIRIGAVHRTEIERTPITRPAAVGRMERHGQHDRLLGDAPWCIGTGQLQGTLSLHQSHPPVADALLQHRRVRVLLAAHMAAAVGTCGRDPLVSLVHGPAQQLDRPACASCVEPLLPLATGQAEKHYMAHRSGGCLYCRGSGKHALPALLRAGLLAYRPHAARPLGQCQRRRRGVLPRPARPPARERPLCVDQRGGQGNEADMGPAQRH